MQNSCLKAIDRKKKWQSLFTNSQSVNSFHKNLEYCYANMQPPKIFSFAVSSLKVLVGETLTKQKAVS